MGVNSIRADKLSPLVPRLLNKKEANIFGQILCLQQQFNFFNSWVFMTFVSVRDLFFSKEKSMKTVQMLFEDCVVPS